MKQEKAVLAPVAGIVKRVLKTADYKETRKMETVREGRAHRGARAGSAHLHQRGVQSSVAHE